MVGRSALRGNKKIKSLLRKSTHEVKDPAYKPTFFELSTIVEENKSISAISFHLDLTKSLPFSNVSVGKPSPHKIGRILQLQPQFTFMYPVDCSAYVCQARPPRTPAYYMLPPPAVHITQLPQCTLCTPEHQQCTLCRTATVHTVHSTAATVNKSYR